MRRNVASAASSCLWTLCVPQMKRTEAMPKPQAVEPRLGGAHEARIVGQPQIVVRAEIEDLMSAVGTAGPPARAICDDWGLSITRSDL